MRFLMLMYPDPTSYEQGAMPDPALIKEMVSYNEQLAKAGALIALDGLHNTSQAVRITYPNGQPTVTDGPFTESKEVLGGYWVIKVANREEAIDWAKKIPPTGTSQVELRQIFEMEDFGPELQEAVTEVRSRTNFESAHRG